MGTEPPAPLGLLCDMQTTDMFLDRLHTQVWVSAKARTPTCYVMPDCGPDSIMTAVLPQHESKGV